MTANLPWKVSAPHRETHWLKPQSHIKSGSFSPRYLKNPPPHQHHQHSPIQPTHGARSHFLSDDYHIKDWKRWMEHQTQHVATTQDTWKNGRPGIKASFRSDFSCWFESVASIILSRSRGVLLDRSVLLLRVWGTARALKWKSIKKGNVSILAGSAGHDGGRWSGKPGDDDDANRAFRGLSSRYRRRRRRWLKRKVSMTQWMLRAWTVRCNEIGVRTMVTDYQGAEIWGDRYADAAEWYDVSRMSNWYADYR